MVIPQGLVVVMHLDVGFNSKVHAKFYQKNICNNINFL
jgi:hypothetical protein